jgi:hypothetical protein
MRSIQQAAQRSTGHSHPLHCHCWRQYWRSFCMRSTGSKSGPGITSQTMALSSTHGANPNIIHSKDIFFLTSHMTRGGRITFGLQPNTGYWHQLHLLWFCTSYEVTSGPKRDTGSDIVLTFCYHRKRRTVSNPLLVSLSDTDGAVCSNKM